ncbi:hypothetical protein EV356DRAFT_493053 [Viridothelium virens]|uniref:Uncharacterized protein n=1 Tax=Viridothelium virens TaxID=1048519 RepID=A0A6A6GWA1_VIRVR|nr:hypothetical protein EV356DRAFT_493053 [Viridothelium virens]
MPAQYDPSDDTVADILKKDARTSSARYAQVGLQALLPKRPVGQAPKPNTRFLRNILRETGSHNAALLAKEAEESRERLKRLQEKSERLETRKDEQKRRKHRDREDEPKSSKRRRNEQDLQRRRSKHKESDDEHEQRLHKTRRQRKHEHPAEENDEQNSQQLKNAERRQKEPNNYPAVLSRKGRKDDGSWQHIRFKSRSPSRSRSPDDPRRKSRKAPLSSATSDDDSPERTPGSTKRRNGSKRSTKEAISASDSDPLEKIIGPLPKSLPQPKKIKFRGRGAFSTTSVMDSHFNSTYDPSADVRPNSDEEDEWGLAVEAYRDRQKWKQQGAERLKAAGFTDEQVDRWEKGGEKREEDVKWGKKGEGREWDRGKVVDEDGDVDVKAEWGRLKGT